MLNTINKYMDGWIRWEFQERDKNKDKIEVLNMTNTFV